MENRFRIGVPITGLWEDKVKEWVKIGVKGVSVYWALGQYVVRFVKKIFNFSDIIPLCKIRG